MAQTPHTYMNFNVGNVSNSYNKTISESGEDEQILRWLSPLEPESRHHGVRSNRFDGIGSWLLETSDFREWRNSEGGADKAVLFCYGNPGVGKTYLSSLVIDSLYDQAREGDIAVAGLYCDFLLQQEQTTINMMGAISKELVRRGGIPAHVRKAFRVGKMELGGRRLLPMDLLKMLRTTIASIPQVFICIDALDECLPKQLPELLGWLRVIVREFPGMRILLTGRPHIREHIRRFFPKASVIPITTKTEDIRNYLQMRLDMDVEPEAMDNGLRADIMRVFLEKISDIFLLVALNIDAILGEVTIRQRRKKLEEMAGINGLSDAYTATVSRLKAQKGYKSVLGLKVLMWVLYSERPLRGEELCHALGVEIGSPDLDPENVPALPALLGSCLGLVTVEEPSSTVRLVHFTLQDHLLSDQSLFHNPHSAIAVVCLTYLNFRCLWDPSPTPESAPPGMPLQEYASCYWGKHARRGMTENVNELALKLLNRRATQFGLRLLG